jgi:hypothetical protein
VSCLLADLRRTAGDPLLLRRQKRVVGVDALLLPQYLSLPLFPTPTPTGHNSDSRSHTRTCVHLVGITLIVGSILMVAAVIRMVTVRHSLSLSHSLVSVITLKACHLAL